MLNMFPLTYAPVLKAPKIEGLFEIGHSSYVAAQVVDAITRKLDQLMVATHGHFFLVLCII